MDTLLVMAIFVILLIVCVHDTASTASHHISQYNYPPGTLPCKLHDQNELDCSNRGLAGIPKLLDRNWTTTADFSRNQISNITGSPFTSLKYLLQLRLQLNTISLLSSTAFCGLYFLEDLDLQENNLFYLPEGIFQDLSKLTFLHLDYNFIASFPIQELLPLKSLQRVFFFKYIIITYTSEVDTDGLQNLTNLNFMTLTVFLAANITNDTFDTLADLPLTSMEFLWVWPEHSSYIIERAAFAPLTKITMMHTRFEAIPIFESLSCPLQSLSLSASPWNQDQKLDIASLQVLKKWNASLIELGIHLKVLHTIEDHTFKWTPKLLVLDLRRNQLNHFTKYAFRGLFSLQTLLLSYNFITAVPSDALQVFKATASLQTLDLGFNKITLNIAKDAFAALSSLSSLKLENNYITDYFHIDWIEHMQNLSHLELVRNADPGYRKWPYVTYIKVDQPHKSLQTIHINKTFHLQFALGLPLCCSFPNLKNLSITDSQVEDLVSSLMELSNCSQLTELDISGTRDFEKHAFPSSIVNNLSIASLQTLKMASLKLKSFKQILFIKASQLKVLDIHDNKITVIENEDMSAFPYLISLNIESNSLLTLSGLQSLTHLETLKAGANQSTTIPIFLLTFRKRSTSLKTLDLSDNPFQCTCDLERFIKWILSDTSTYLLPGQYLCASPESVEGKSITEIELDCRSPMALYLSISIPSTILLVSVIILLFRYQWHIKYKIFLLYRHYHALPENNNDLEMRDFHYQAYVSYDENSAKDDAWVMNELQPNMERDPEPLLLCIKRRDFTPGNFLLDSINESINHSRKTILVLSKSFVASEWCYYEMQMAQMRLLDDNLDVLILVLLENIPERKITMSLRQLLCRKDYLKWPKGKAGQRLFWRRLSEEIKGTVHVDRCFQV